MAVGDKSRMDWWILFFKNGRVCSNYRGKTIPEYWSEEFGQ